VKETITKPEAAKRQLRIAIRMFFDEADGVATYTLAAAAQEVLRGLLTAKGEEEASFIKDSLSIVPEHRQEFLRIVNRPQNFFKHADRDPHEVLEFEPDLLPFVLQDSVQMYQRLTGKILREGLVFYMWFMFTYPDFLKEEALSAVASAYRAGLSGPPDKAMMRELLQREWPREWPNTE
jgi:hypothetical protein